MWFVLAWLCVVVVVWFVDAVLRVVSMCGCCTWLVCVIVWAWGGCCVCLFGGVVLCLI